MATKLATYMAANPGFGPVESAVEVLLSNLGAGGAQGNMIDGSATIPDGASHQVFAANATRKYLLIQAPKTNAQSVYFNETIAAVAGPPSIEIQPGGGYVFEGDFIPTGAINIIGTAADKYTAKQA